MPPKGDKGKKPSKATSSEESGDERGGAEAVVQDKSFICTRTRRRKEDEDREREKERDKLLMETIEKGNQRVLEKIDLFDNKIHLAEETLKSEIQKSSEEYDEKLQNLKKTLEMENQKKLEDLKKTFEEDKLAMKNEMDDLRRDGIVTRQLNNILATEQLMMRARLDVNEDRQFVLLAAGLALYCRFFRALFLSSRRSKGRKD